MRTSYSQYLTMLNFMENNGDLSKPTRGPRDRPFVQKKWKELTMQLNRDRTGDPRTDEKWRKVWSDYKNNCKKKYVKINKAGKDSSGRPALQLSLSDLENRVVQIMGLQSTFGMVVDDAELPLNDDTETPPAHIDEPVSKVGSDVNDSDVFYMLDWSTPGTSSKPTVQPQQSQRAETPASFTSSTSSDEERMPSQRKQTKDLVKLLIHRERKAREYARQRERVNEELERERLRLRELDLLERVRQRDIELHMQSQWLHFLKDAMNVFVRYMEKKS